MTAIAPCMLSPKPLPCAHSRLHVLELISTSSRTFLKRKGGLFKKAHELSVLCSVDVAVFIFGNNKKLYEYSSADMQHLITKYQYVSSTKGPLDRPHGFIHFHSNSGRTCLTDVMTLIARRP